MKNVKKEKVQEEDVTVLTGEIHATVGEQANLPLIPAKYISKQDKIIRVDADNGHWYKSDKDDTWKKSLTYILDAGFPLSFGLKDFFQTHTKAEADELLNDAGLSGSKIHHTIHLMNLGQEVSSEGFTDEQIKFMGFFDRELINYLRKPFSKDEDQKMKGYLQFVADFQPEMIEHERILISDKHGFGCTLDTYSRVYIPADKRSYKEFAGKEVKAFIDYKSGKGIYYKNEVQIVMCGVCYREGVKKTRGDIHAILHLGVNKAGYRFKIVKDPKKAVQDFIIVKKVSEIEKSETEPKFYEFEAIYKLKK